MYNTEKAIRNCMVSAAIGKLESTKEYIPSMMEGQVNHKKIIMPKANALIKPLILQFDFGAVMKLFAVSGQRFSLWNQETLSA